MPDSLKPPNGCRSTSAPVILRLTYRLPTRNSRRTRITCSGLREYSPPVRAYGTPLAISSACVRSRARITDGTENLFLGDPRPRRHVAEDVRRDVETLVGQRAQLAGVGERRLLLAALDRGPDAVAGLGVDDGAQEVARVLRRADLQPLRRLDHPRHERVVDTLQDHGPRAGAALLPLVAERAVGDAEHRLVQVGVLVDDDRVLAAHLGEHALDVRLPGGKLRRLAVQHQ